MVPALSKVGTWMSIESNVSVNPSSSTLQWSASLAERWNIPALPKIWCEKKRVGEVSLGRLALSESALKEQIWWDLNEPVKLTIHAEAKPWGREIWYSGIEKRGVCGVQTQSGVVQLPAYLELLAGSAENSNHSPVAPPLLKILDPRDDPREGCLYIEVHKEKWETYIVTSVDARAWPEGRGDILFGFSDEKWKEHGGDWQKILAGVEKAVQAYEKVRRQIDALPKQNVDPTLTTTERALWADVRSWFGVRQVAVGDVIEVPPFVPHSLQNGVRVVEFQTPTYERLILAFNQQVQTQKHWDTSDALHFAQRKTLRELLADSASRAASMTEQNKGWECIVDFPGFRVLRNTLQAGALLDIPESKRQREALVFVVKGTVQLNSASGHKPLTLGAEEAAFIPAQNALLNLSHQGTGPAVVLIV